MNKTMLRAKRASTQGFTLLELLVGLTLFGVISIALYSGLSHAIKSTAAGERRNQEVRQVMALQTLLTSKVYAAKRLKKNNRKAEMIFNGEPQAIRFVSDMPQSIKQGGDGIYFLSVLTDGLGSRLQISLKTPLKTEKTALNTVFDEVVELADITGLSLQYYGSENTKDKPSWHSSWLNKKQFPLLLRVDFSTKSGSLWPPIIIALRAAKKVVSTTRQRFK
ncbi:MAG: prepilin-type N-terminal cleavage/methylation domain-containing protein [Cycloclasticus sp.]